MTPIADLVGKPKKLRGNRLADLVKRAHLREDVSDLDKAAEIKENPMLKPRKRK